MSEHHIAAAQVATATAALSDDSHINCSSPDFPAVRRTLWTSCTANVAGSDGGCPVHSDSNQFVAAILYKQKLDRIREDFFEVLKEFNFKITIHYLADNIKREVPVHDRLNVLLAIAAEYEQGVEHDATASTMLRPRDKYIERASREIDGIAHLAIPQDASPFDGLPLPRSLPGTPSSVASAPASLSSSTSSNSLSSTRSDTLSNSSAGDVFLASSPSLGPGFNAAELEHHVANFHNAQNSLPAGAILFIGNLPASYTDLQLLRAVHEMCDEYAQCYVNISRTYTKHHVKPHALVQFYTEITASMACEWAQGKKLGGRELRVELSKANRWVRVLRADGYLPDTREVVAALGPFGAFEQMRVKWSSVHVQFVCYGTYLRVKEAFRDAVVGGLIVF